MAEESDLKLRTRYLCEVDGAVQLSDSPFGESTLATWHDIECSRGEDDIAAVRELIANECRVNADEVDSNDVDKAAIDLAEPDHWPEVTHFGVIRKLSATCIAPGDIGDASAKDPLFICGNRVEVAMGPKWVVSAWHTTEQISPRGSLLRP